LELNNSLSKRICDTLAEDEVEVWRDEQIEKYSRDDGIIIEE